MIIQNIDPLLHRHLSIEKHRIRVRAPPAQTKPQVTGLDCGRDPLKAHECIVQSHKAGICLVDCALGHVRCVDGQVKLIGQFLCLRPPMAVNEVVDKETSVFGGL